MAGTRDPTWRDSVCGMGRVGSMALNWSLGISSESALAESSKTFLAPFLAFFLVLFSPLSW